MRVKQNKLMQIIKLGLVRIIYILWLEMLSFWCNFLKNKLKQSLLQFGGGDFTAVFTDLTENIGFSINTIVTRPCLGVIS